VLWVVLGLVSLTLYFAHSMGFQLRAGDHRAAAIAASQTIDGATRYLTNYLALYATNGAAPDTAFLEAEEVPIGDSTFWLLGRDTNSWQNTLTEPWFGLIDEASKLNLNTATREMLELLPGMTTEFAAAIVDWRDTDSEPADSGAEDETYARLNPPYRAKNAPFESIEELRLVAGADLLTLFGEDTNLNGILDPNEDDGDESFPTDNRDGRLDPGILEYVTVASAEPNTRADGSTRIDVSDPSQAAVASYLQEQLGTERSNAILRQLGVTAGGGGPGGGTGGPGAGNPGGNPGTATPVRSVLEFAILGGLTAEELARIDVDLAVTNTAALPGLVNVYTASAEVLACIPGIGIDNAQTVIAARASNGQAGSLLWLVDTLGRDNALLAGPHLTSRAYQYTADIAALGPHKRGYQRVRYLIDLSSGSPRIRARRDLTHLGWALGRDLRDTFNLLATRNP
jgi:DNA uptake protein ComE-like DNA-binding protein